MRNRRRGNQHRQRRTGRTRACLFLSLADAADKANYGAYCERVLTPLRPGGLAAIDNVRLDGEVVEAAPEDPNTRTIRKLNAKLKNNDGITISMMPLGAGPTLAKKR